MRNLVSALIIVSIFFTCSVPCFAKSTLTYFDTVVLEAQSETSREAVLYQVSDSAKNNSENITAPAYTSENRITQTGFSSLKEIMSGAAQTFFRK